MKKRRFALAAAALAGSSPAAGHDLICRNEAAEIRCDGGRCRAETESFTPMQFTLRRRAVTLCAYSGCWEGHVSFSRASSGIRFIQARMRRAGPGDAGTGSMLSVMLSRRDATAQMNWDGFLSVLECRPPGA